MRDTLTVVERSKAVAVSAAAAIDVVERLTRAVLSFEYRERPEGHEGYVFSAKVPGTAPLRDFFRWSRSDSFYVVTDASYLHQHQHRGVVGYVYPRTECRGNDWGKPW